MENGELQVSKLTACKSDPLAAGFQVIMAGVLTSTSSCIFLFVNCFDMICLSVRLSVCLALMAERTNIQTLILAWRSDGRISTGIKIFRL